MPVITKLQHNIIWVAQILAGALFMAACSCLLVALPLWLKGEEALRYQVGSVWTTMPYWVWSAPAALLILVALHGRRLATHRASSYAYYCGAGLMTTYSAAIQDWHGQSAAIELAISYATALNPAYPLAALIINTLVLQPLIAKIITERETVLAFAGQTDGKQPQAPA